MQQVIAEALRELEAREDIRVLYACESGSRAWGFASVDSDYDVRFLYVRRLESYISVKPPRDVLEAMLPGDLDLAGWDMRKTLQLLTKSNPSLFEWIASPIVYSSNEEFTAEFKLLADRWYSRERIFKHYLHMAEGNWRAYLQGEEVSRKKYLYVLRPVLACLWLNEERGTVPMEFDVLRGNVIADEEVAHAVELLLAEKKAGHELAVGPRDPVLHEYISKHLNQLSQIRWAASERRDVAELDAFLMKWIPA